MLPYLYTYLGNVFRLQKLTDIRTWNSVSIFFIIHMKIQDSVLFSSSRKKGMIN